MSDDDLLDACDFRKIAAYMELRGWEWTNTGLAPTAPELRAHTARLLKQFDHLCKLHPETENPTLEGGGIRILKLKGKRQIEFVEALAEEL